MHRYVEGTIPLPAAGSDISFTPSHAERFKLISLYGVLTASATVANRRPALKALDRSGNVFFAKAVISDQAASAAVAYSWSSFAAPANAGSAVEDGIVSDGVPNWWMPAGTEIVTVTANLAAGDKWTALYYTALIYDEAELRAEIADWISSQSS